MTVDYFAELGRRQGEPNLQEADEVTTRYHILVAMDRKKEKETGADALRAQWGKQRLRITLPEPDSGLWESIAAPTLDLAILPSYSFTLRFTFTLARPYLSKDDNAFYIIDNPIARDKVFRLPLVRPSSWKGNLYSALWHKELKKKEDDERLQRLFGIVCNTQGETGEAEGHAGRLIFFPTFFTQTSLEIINPHNRKTKVGMDPILFESVPTGAKGTFTLLYMPFDRVGEDEQITRAEVAEDLSLLARGVQAMFRICGFSAKRTSGFGLAQEDGLQGILQMRVEEFTPSTTPAPLSKPIVQPQLARYLVAPNKLKPEYMNPDGTFRERGEKELQAMKKADRQVYDKAKGWWESKGKALANQSSAQPETVAPIETPREPQWLTRPFESFTELVTQADEAAQWLNAGGAQ